MSSDFYSEKTFKARKGHKCEICGKAIEPGEKYVRKAGVHDGDFWSAVECEDCQPIITEFCQTSYGEDGYNEDAIEEWWTDEKCPNCRTYFALCEPDGSCSVNCVDRNSAGRCTAGDTCDLMTRHCWCEKYDPVNTQHITRPGETAYDLAEKYYGDRELWPLIENSNGKWHYGLWELQKKRYKAGETIIIPKQKKEETP